MQTGRWKNALEWVKLIAELFTALGVKSIVHGLLSLYTNLPSIWITVNSWSTAILVLWLLIVFVQRIWGNESNRTQQQEKQDLTTSSILAGGPPMDLRDMLKDAYNTTLQSEAEATLQSLIDRLPKEIRHETMLAFMARSVITSLHDYSWFSIYRSQLLLLQSLNQSPQRMEVARKLYDDAKEQFPDDYGDYRFDQWLDYLKRNSLIVMLPAEAISITKRGQDFLKYLVHNGRTDGMRKL